MKSVCAVVCSTSETRLLRTIEPSMSTLKFKKLEKDLNRGIKDIFGQVNLGEPLTSEDHLGFDKVIFALNFTGAFIVISVILNILI